MASNGNPFAREYHANHFSQQSQERVAGLCVEGRREPYRGELFGQPWPRQPIPVRAGPWTSDSLTLERDGWKFESHYKVDTMQHQVVCHKQGVAGVLVMNDIELHMQNGAPLVFNAQLVETVRSRHVLTNDMFVPVSMQDAWHCEH